jgi:hypothetical protein
MICCVAAFWCTLISAKACAAVCANLMIGVVLQFGVTLAYLLVAYCYFGVAYTGYHAFGSMTGDQILYSLGHPIWVVCLASVMVIIHVCGSFQVSCCLH